MIELLVVIAVIAILAAILFPVFARAREQARKATCVSNTRQVGMAFLLYTQDNDESYPNTGDPYLYAGKHWRWPIMPYLSIGQRQAKSSFSSAAGSSSILICPSDVLSGSSFDSTSYDYSACFFHSPAQIDQMHFGDLLSAPAGLPTITQTIAALAYPAQKALLGEWYTNHEHPGVPIGYWGSGFVPPATPGADRWRGGRVYMLADGHAKFLHAHAIHPSADDCPDINLTPDGLSGYDLP